MKIAKTAAIISESFVVENDDGTALVRAVKKMPQKILTAGWLVGGTESTIIDLEEYRAVGLEIPANFRGTQISLIASTDGVYFAPIFDTQGFDFKIMASPRRRIILNPADLYGVAYLKLVSNSAQISATNIKIIAEA